MEGLDLSQFQGDVRWAEVTADFVFIRSSDGLSYLDPAYSTNLAGALIAGVPFGAYHFGRTDADPLKQAQAFANLGVGGFPLRPVLDLELNVNAAWGRKFLESMERRTGLRPILYTYTSQLPLLDSLKDYDLWLADWSVDDGSYHVPPATDGWNLVCHQYTSRGSAPGITGYVDRNFAGSLALLQRGVIADWLEPWMRWYLAGRTGTRPPQAPTAIPAEAWPLVTAALDHAAPILAELAVANRDYTVAQADLTAARTSVSELTVERDKLARVVEAVKAAVGV